MMKGYDGLILCWDDDGMMIEIWDGIGMRGMMGINSFLSSIFATSY